MKKVNFKDEKKIEFALRELTRGVQKMLFDDDICRNILISAVDIKGVKFVDQKKSILLSAVSRFSKYKKKTLVNFKKAINSEVNFRNKSKKKNFSVILFLNIDRRMISSKKRYFTILGRKLFVRNFRYINRNFNRDKARREALSNSGALSTKVPLDRFMFQPIEIKVPARSNLEAFWDSYEKFEVFRGILNFSNNFCCISHQYGWRGHLNSFLPLPIYEVYESGGEFSSIGYEIGKYNYKKLKFGRSFKPMIFNELLKAFKVELKDESLMKEI